MKKVLAFVLAISFLALASEKYGVYDLQGSHVSTFEAEPHELPEKARRIKSDNPHKQLYVSSLRKGKSSKPSSAYYFKTGSYIETSRNDVFSICPDKKSQGTWISEYSVALDEKNCLSVQAPDLAGTFYVLFMENSGLTDTIQVLVDQSYIQMGDYLHKMWVTDLDYGAELPEQLSLMGYFLNDFFNGHYESRSYSQPLIVDKTKFTMGDAQHFSKIGDIEFSSFTLEKYPENEKFEGSRMPLINHSSVWKFANERSKKEGLDTVYYKNTSGSIELDTSASGYRVPFHDEWFFLMRAGAHTRYYWGDEEDSLTVSRYVWVRPVGLKPVAQLLPNRFDLYDMIGIAGETVVSSSNVYNVGLGYECQFMKTIRTLIPYMTQPYTECIGKFDEGRICTKIESQPSLMPVDYNSFRLVRKTPKLHKLEKL
jgi:hypothetical protein